MTGEMIEDEICCLYRQARHKHRQVGILAQLYACPQGTIKTILATHGYDVPERKQLNRPHWKWKPEFTAALPGLLAAGYTVPQLAERFGIGKQTVTIHIRELGLHTLNSRINKGGNYV